MTEIDQMLAEVRRQYRPRLVQQLAELRELIRRGDTRSAQPRVHRIRGTAGSYGFHDVAERLAQARALLRAEPVDLPQLAELIDEAHRLASTPDPREPGEPQC